jgi:hypothetical protein
VRGRIQNREKEGASYQVEDSTRGRKKGRTKRAAIVEKSRSEQ